MCSPVSAADLIERTQAEQRQTLLAKELNHRVEKHAGIVQALAQQSFRGADVPEEPGALSKAGWRRSPARTTC